MDETTGATEAPPPVAPEGERLIVGGKRKVCIVGFAPGRELAPYDDTSWEFWALNEMYLAKDVRKIDVLFEIHDYNWIKEGKRNPRHLQWLQKASIPLVMQRHFADIPNSIPFPRAILEEKYGAYFTNTISWEIALAMHIGVEEIAIYGVNMATDVEYTSQRPSCEYYIGLARGMGIKVYLPPESDLLKCFYQYGFEDGELSIMAQRLKRLEDEQAEKRRVHEEQVHLHSREQAVAEGARGAFAQVRQAFVYPHGSWEAERG